MRLHFAIFCQDVRIMDNGKLQINDPIVNLVSDKKPAFHNGVVVVNFSPEDAESHVLELKVRAPYGKEGSRPYRAEFQPVQDKKEKIGHIVNLDELILEEEGQYTIEVIIDGKLMTAMTFDFEVEPCPVCPAPTA